MTRARRRSALRASIAHSRMYRRPVWVSRTGPYWLFKTRRRPTVVSSSDQWHGPDFWRDLTTDLLFYMYNPTPGDVVIDIGAGMGEELPYLDGAVGPTGRIVAIEAHPQAFDGLVLCIALNHLVTCEPVAVAIADQTGTTMITNSSDLDINTTLSMRPDAQALQVSAFALDDLCDRMAIGHVDLLKMNIEGAERLAIIGMPRVLARTSNVVISCHDFLVGALGDDSFRTKELVLDALIAAGFAVATRTDDRPFAADYVYGTRPVESRRASAVPSRRRL